MNQRLKPDFEQADLSTMLRYGMILDQILRDLSVIAKVPVHGKLCSNRSGFYIQRHMPFGVESVVRWIKCDNRTQTIHDLNVLITRIHEKSSDIGTVPDSICQKIPAALKGLMVLKSTYGADPVCVSEIELVMQKLQEFDIGGRKAGGRG